MEGQQRRTVQKGARFKIQRENKARMLVRFNLPIGRGKKCVQGVSLLFRIQKVHAMIPHLEGHTQYS